MVDGRSVPLPEFIEVPPVILQGDNSYIAGPVKAGDYCLVLISEHCYDSWYAGSDFVSPLEMRRHDYSDGFTLGVNPAGKAISIPAARRLMQGDTDHNGSMYLTGDLKQSAGKATLEECEVVGQMKYGTLQTAGKKGVTGSFRSDDGKTITVTNGIITGIPKYFSTASPCFICSLHCPAVFKVSDHPKQHHWFNFFHPHMTNHRQDIAGEHSHDLFSIPL